MVRFEVPTHILKQTTEKAQWFTFGPDSPYKDISVPLTKVAIKHNDNGSSDVIMPKWVYMKYPPLQSYINDEYNEFRHFFSVDDNTLF